MKYVKLPFVLAILLCSSMHSLAIDCDYLLGLRESDESGTAVSVEIPKTGMGAEFNEKNKYLPSQVKNICYDDLTKLIASCEKINQEGSFRVCFSKAENGFNIDPGCNKEEIDRWLEFISTSDILNRKDYEFVEVTDTCKYGSSGSCSRGVHAFRDCNDDKEVDLTCDEDNVGLKVGSFVGHSKKGADIMRRVKMHIKKQENPERYLMAIGTKLNWGANKGSVTVFGGGGQCTELTSSGSESREDPRMHSYKLWECIEVEPKSRCGS